MILPLPQAQTAWILLAFCAALIAIFLWNDLPDYRRFKALTATGERRRHFRKWIVKSALMFGGTALAGLAILGRLPALAGSGVPAEFAPLAAPVPHVPIQEYFGPFLIGAGIGVFIGGAAVFAISRLRKKRPAKMVTLGDIEPILPRNNGERVWAALLALNAGWCEELFFRLLLPLLLTLASGNVLFGFGIAVAIFGLVHLYQGVAGMLATAVLGALFAAIYVVSGNIWIAAAAHALVDLNGLLLQPLLRGYRSPKSA